MRARVALRYSKEAGCWAARPHQLSRAFVQCGCSRACAQGLRVGLAKQRSLLVERARGCLTQVSLKRTM